MELVCPSCGAKHRTEDHPGAFEILCVCGYSILVPDEAALAIPVPEPSRMSSVPIAVEEADEPIAMPAPSSAESAPQPLDMTPPEQLPEGMVYDPFELGQPPITSPDAFAAPPFPSPEEPGSAADETPPPPQAQTSVPTPTSAPASDSGQALVERAQSASMGRLLGSSYNLECYGLERDALVEVARRCLKLIKQRPWLESEIRGRRLDLESLPDVPHLAEVPELLALEIYLACFELGGSCHVTRSDAP